MINSLLANTPGNYRVILERVECVDPKANDLFEKIGDVFNREELYTYALGLINEMELEEFQHHFEYHEIHDLVLEFSYRVRAHYEFSLPEELKNEECFSVAIVPYNDVADIYIFTCEVPPTFAESKHGINFDYLGRFFPGQN